jgi:hypothetical protein
MTWSIVLAIIALAVSIGSIAIALLPRPSDAASRVRRLELELAELGDLVEHQTLSLKKLHGRAATRASREQAALTMPSSDDPMARRPGESGEQWKARINSTLSPIRRN